MKLKCFLVLLVVTITFFAFSVNSYAQEINYTEIYEAANEATENLLEQAGIENIDYEEILKISPEKVFDVLVSMVKGSLKTPFQTAGIIIAVIIIFSVLRNFSQSSLQNDEYYSFFENSLILTSVLYPLSQLISAAVSVIKTVCDFMLAFIPVYTGVISASGQPVTAFLYSSALLSFAEICGFTLADLFVPIVSVIACINIFSSLSTNLSLEALITTFKRFVTLSISVAGSLFVGFVNLKTELAYSADSLTLKGIKMLSGSVVPVIGSTIGEALNSVIGAVALIKSTLGVFAIIAVALTCLPTVTQLLLWHFSIYLCSAVSDALNLTSVSKALKVITGLISIICIILVTIMLIFILTAGNMISLRG